MYILTFKRSRSKYFEKGLALAEKLGGTWDGETMVLKIQESKLLRAYDRLLPLFVIVGRWSSLRASFRGQEVDPYRFILMMHFIKECAGVRSLDPEHCWLSPDERGWGCKRLSKVQYQLFGDGQYASNERFWYNFGRFNAHNEWLIDKETLYERLYRHAEATGLVLCPFFDVKKLRKALDGLPDRIVPDDNMFRLHYEEEFYRGERIEMPVNIRHIPDPSDTYEQPQPGKERKYNPDAIIPIDHSLGMKPKKSPGGRFWNRFSKN
jgi:hypothetical protein